MNAMRVVWGVIKPFMMEQATFGDRSKPQNNKCRDMAGKKLPAQPQICRKLSLRAKIWRFWNTSHLHFKTILLPNQAHYPIASAQAGLIAAS